MSRIPPIEAVSRTPIIDAEVHLLHDDWLDHLDAEPHIAAAFRDHPDAAALDGLLGLDALLSSMDAAHITRAQLLGVSWQNESNNSRNNDALFAAAARYPDRFDVFPVWNIHPAAEAIATLAAYPDASWRGLKIVGGWQGQMLDDSRHDALFSWLARRGKILFVHVNHLSQDPVFDTPQRLLTLARRHPDLKIMAAHMGGMLFAYEGFGRIAPQLANILWITSVSATMYMVRWAMEVCADKVAFGSDFPFNHCHSQEEPLIWLQQRLAPEHLAGVLSENLERFLG